MKVGAETMLASFVYATWRRNRRSYIFGGGALIACMVALRLVGHPEPVHQSFVQPMLLMEAPMFMLFGFAFLAMRTIMIPPFGVNGIPIPGPFEPTYPKTMFALPAPTRLLVVAPMIAAGLVVLLIWALFCLIDAVPLGMNIPFLTPALAVCLMVALSQGMWWLGNSKPGLGAMGVSLSMFVLPALFFAFFKEIPEPTINLGLGLLLFGAIGVALWAAPFGRTGCVPVRSAVIEREISKRKITVVKTIDRSDFPSNLTAFRWFDWRSGQVKILPILYAVISVGLLLRVPFSDNDIGSTLGIGAIQIGPVTKQFLASIAVMIFFGGAMSALFLNSLYAPSTVMKNPTLNQWLSVRPITSAQIIGCKFLNAARAALYLTATCLIGFALWMFLPAEEKGRSASILSLVASHTTTPGAIAGVIAVVCLLLLAWTTQLGNPLDLGWRHRFTRWIGRAPILVIVYVELAGNYLMPYFLPPLSGLRDSRSPEHIRKMFDHPGLVNIPISLLFTIGIPVLAIKAVTAGIGTCRLQKQQLVQSKTLITGACIWISVAAVIFAGLVYAVPASSFPPSAIAVAMLLILPVNRLIWPTLTVDAARHK